MHDLRVYRADAHAVEEILKDVRDADREELIASSGPDFATTLHEAHTLSELSLCVYTHDKPLCVFGIARPTLLSDEGVPWLIGTRFLESKYKDLGQVAPAYIRDFRRGSSLLFNYVDARNRKAVVWLRRMGFTLYPAQPFGFSGLPFHRFEMKGLI